MSHPTETVRSRPAAECPLGRFGHGGLDARRCAVDQGAPSRRRRDRRSSRALQDTRHAARLSVYPPIRLSVGFTLIELLVVLVVISILAGLVAPAVFHNVGDAKIRAARAQIELLGVALDSYRLDNGEYPTTPQGLGALWAQPTTDPVPARWRGPYTRKAVPNDPWGRAFIYRAPGDSSRLGYDLMTYGRDGKEGGSGEDEDLKSWSGS